MVSQIEDLTTADENFILPQEEETGDVLFDEESLAHTSFNPNAIDISEINSMMRSQKQAHKGKLNLTTRRQRDAKPRPNRLGISINEVDAARNSP